MKAQRGDWNENRTEKIECERELNNSSKSDGVSLTGSQRKQNNSQQMANGKPSLMFDTAG